MRRLLAPIVLAAALVAAVAPPASAESCYGADEVAYACTDGQLLAETQNQEVGACLYTGGSTCTPYYVDVPTVAPGDFRVTRVCVADDPCYTLVLGEFWCRFFDPPKGCD